ncbi:vitamin K epoxide reductase family protein [Nocardioides sp. JQ2195]|uniref:vitamin K epoxide reductase family protein n=1 Tax=Nocardioides sp. JQ2195 TaxID=2592334 RepID=UPI00143ECCE4|nr:vitamin K epoxide reductase family protein [Nocardioides sp. JQ2195]QIX27098.1 vitamin K epoxide reductase family protein [Nocardioides sp. JQ2195]
MSEEAAVLEAQDGVIIWGRATGILVAVLSFLGLAAAFTLSVDKVKLLQDPSFEPSCNFNPILSCGSVMATEQASVFGFANPFLGVVGFSIVLTLGALLAAGGRVPTPIVAGAAIGTIAGTVFVHWLIFQSLYRIGALCPWCMVVWAVTIPLAWWFTLKAVEQVASGDGVRRVVRVLWDWRFTVVGLWYVGVAVLVLARFWDFWTSNL